MSINYNLSVNDAANVVDTSPATGGLTNTELRASPVPFSASALPLPAGAATNAELVNLEGIALDASSSNNTRLDSVNAKLASGIPITNFPTSTTVTNTVAVSGTFYPATQPISGSVSVSNFPATQAISAAALPLPSGAATETSLSALNNKVTTSINGLKVDGSAVTQPVSGTFYQSTQPVSIAAPVAVTGPLTDVQLRAAVVPVSLASTTISNTVPVTGAFYQSTQPVSGSVAITNFPATQAITGALTDTQLRASAVPVSLASTTVTNTVGVSGAFYQSTQPVSGAFFQSTQPVSGTFYQSTQPVSGAFYQPTQPVSGSFYQSTQPVSGAFYQATQPVSGTVAVSNLPAVLKVSDGLGSTGINGNLNLVTANTAYEAIVSATRLANRKSVLIQAVDNDVYWGYTSSVTASSGALLLKGQTIEFACDPASAFQVWLVAALANKNVRIAEST